MARRDGDYLDRKFGPGRSGQNGEPRIEAHDRRKRDLIAEGKSRSQAGLQAFRELADKRARKENG